MEKIKGIIDGVKSGWDKMDKNKRILMISILSSIILFASLYTYIARRPNYTTLFNNLELEDAGKIVNDLESKKIKYKLEDDGTKILIDSKFVDKYRLQLAMEGNMPENSSGFEIFDSVGLMVTDDDRKIMYQRALEGEIQRSIMSLDAVDSAKVHLVMSEKSIFETQEKEASASIVLALNPDEKISESMIKGIAALISGAVENLPEENIRIVDSKGNLLSSVLQEDDSLNSIDIVTKYQKIKEDFEGKMESSLKGLLEDVFGRDKIRVSVNADLDFDAEETTSVKYSDPVIRSEQISASGENINTQGSGGNIGDNPSAVIDTVSGDGSSYERTTNHELSTETTTIVKAPGKIRRLTTSVVHDGTLPEGSPKIEQIKDIVAAATGYDEERGDDIQVKGILFDRSHENTEQEELDRIRKEMEDSKGFFAKHKDKMMIIAAGLIGMGVLIVVFKVLRGKKKEEEALALESTIDAEVGIDNLTKDIERLEDKIEVTIDNDERKAKQYAKENPDLAADLIKVWLKN